MVNRLLKSAKWFTLFSFLLLLVSVVSYVNANEDIEEIYDPIGNNMAELPPEGSQTVELKENGIYIALRVRGFDIEPELKLINSTGKEYLGRSPVWLDFPRVGVDDTIYDVVRVFEPTQNEEYIFYNEGNNTLWLIDEVSNQRDVSQTTSIFIFSIGCCLGIPIGVIAFILAIMGWRKGLKGIDKGVKMDSSLMIDPKGTEIKIIKSPSEVPDPFINKSSNVIKQIEKPEKDTKWEDWDNQ